jgi:DNA-binding NarL/FixJ family response regulator
MNRPVQVFCIDDNVMLAEALQRRLSKERDLHWVGWTDERGDVLGSVGRQAPDVVLLDIDLPGHDSFELVREIAARSPGTRVLMFSAHLRREYIERALDAGAWGYVSKSEQMHDILRAVRAAAAGEIVLTPDARREYLNQT